MDKFYKKTYKKYKKVFEMSEFQGLSDHDQEVLRELVFYHERRKANEKALKKLNKTPSR